MLCEVLGEWRDGLEGRADRVGHLQGGHLYGGLRREGSDYLGQPGALLLEVLQLRLKFGYFLVLLVVAAGADAVARLQQRVGLLGLHRLDL